MYTEHFQKAAAYLSLCATNTADDPHQKRLRGDVPFRFAVGRRGVNSRGVVLYERVFENHFCVEHTRPLALTTTL
jgi:hypothetical protein